MGERAVPDTVRCAADVAHWLDLGQPFGPARSSLHPCWACLVDLLERLAAQPFDQLAGIAAHGPSPLRAFPVVAASPRTSPVAPRRLLLSFLLTPSTTSLSETAHGD